MSSANAAYPVPSLRMRRLMTTMASAGPWRFAPLRRASGSPPSGGLRLRGVVFDMDGTLCEPQTYMFQDMRSALGISKAVDILEHIEGLPAPQQPAAYAAIGAIEHKAMAAQTPQPGLAALMSYLDSHRVPKAICTRNFDLPVQHLLAKFLPTSRFCPVVTRDFRPPKPHPAGILHIAQRWGLTDGVGAADATGLIMVGDSLDDLTAGRLAGAATVLLLNDVNTGLASHEHTDLVIRRLDELVEVLEQGFQGRKIELGEAAS